MVAKVRKHVSPGGLEEGRTQNPGVGTQARVHGLDECASILDVFQSHGHDEVDTARIYGDGSAEEYLGRLDWHGRGLKMATKIYPTAGMGMTLPGAPLNGWTHSPEHLRESLTQSLAALGTDKVDTWYLHAPDRKTPFEVTLNAVNTLHQEGLFVRFAISNFMAWEVAQICELCNANGWVRPSVYQVNDPRPTVAV